MESNKPKAGLPSLNSWKFGAPKRQSTGNHVREDSTESNDNGRSFRSKLRSDVSAPTTATPHYALNLTEIPSPSVSRSHYERDTPPPISSPPDITFSSAADYSLDVLLVQFGKMADKKIAFALSYDLNHEISLDEWLGLECDPKFDNTLRALGMMARHRPKPVIESVMRWRKSKTEIPQPEEIKRLSESSGVKMRDAQAKLKERQSQAAIYILCRSLLEIIKHLRADKVSDELGDRLEETIFLQVRGSDPDQISRSPNRMANMNMFAELLGALSNISDRFISELEKYNKENIMKEKQSKIELMIRSMRYLQLKLYPLEALEETAEFLQSLAAFYRSAHGSKVKEAYANLFVELLLPAAAVANAEVNFPAWVKAIEVIYEKAMVLAVKPKQDAVMVGYPLVTATLCVSTREFFLSQWLSFVDLCYQRFAKQDKIVRQKALGCLSRLVWCYLYRCMDSQINVQKRLDNIFKTLFPSGRRSITPLEVPLEYFVQVLYFMLMNQTEYVFRSVVLHMLSCAGTSIPTLESIYPERGIIGITAFLHVLKDLEDGRQRPEFPTETDMDAVLPSLGSADVLNDKVFLRNNVREQVERINDIIGKQWLTLDAVFGPMTVLDDKYNGSRPGVSSNEKALFANGMPITADTGQQVQMQYSSFSYTYSREKQPYFDLIRTFVDSVPRLMPSTVTLPKLVTMLSRYTMHIDPAIARASSDALLRLAQQCEAHIVVSGYAKYVCSIEDRHTETLISLANGPLTGGDYNSTGGWLKLYKDLLSVWVQCVDIGALGRYVRVAGPRLGATSDDIEIKNIMSILEEAESIGLSYLCSTLPLLRRWAMEILRLLVQFDQRVEQHFGKVAGDDRPQSLASYLTTNVAGKGESYRLYHLIDNIGPSMVTLEDDCLLGEKVSSSTRDRIRQHQRKGLKGVLAKIAVSEHNSDIVIWNICFPRLILSCFETFPYVVALARQNICARITQMRPYINTSSDIAGRSAGNSLSLSKATSGGKVIPASEALIQQFKVYMIYVCSTFVRSKTIESPISTTPWTTSHKRSVSTDKLAAPDIFELGRHFLLSEDALIREAAVAGLGHTNKTFYKDLILALGPSVNEILEETKLKLNGKQQSKRRKTDRLRTEIMHIYSLTADSLMEETHLRDVSVIDPIMTYVKETRSFLSDVLVQGDWDFHRLRRYFCQLIDKLYDAISKLETPTDVMSFETRLNLFKMFEEWSGYGPNSTANKEREAKVLQQVLEQCRDAKERAQMKTLVEEERKALEYSAQRAMSSLCRGPLIAYLGRDKNKKQSVIQFDVQGLLSWIDAVFGSSDPRIFRIAKQALEAILVHNQGQTSLLEDVIEQCYAGNPKLRFTQGYFMAFADVVIQVDDYPCRMHQIMSLALYKTGDPEKKIRKSALELLRVMEERVYADSCAKEYEIGILNDMSSTYRQTQLLLSARLAVDHADQTHTMLAEITRRFDYVSATSQREVLAYMLPWLQNLDFNSDTTEGGISLSTIMVLTNLFYLTIKYGDIYVREMEIMWHQLLFKNPTNAQQILLFLTELCIERRNPWFIIQAKRIFVFLGRAGHANYIIDHVIATITPRSMVPQLSSHEKGFALDTEFPLYVADVGKAIKKYPRRPPIFSRGQLACIFLVDLATEAGEHMTVHLPLLLHAIFVQLDSITSLACDQMRWFLINLTYSIVVRQTSSTEALVMAEDLITYLNDKEGKRLWPYEDITIKNAEIQSANQLQELLQTVVNIFAYEEPDLRQKWGEVALQWATSCPVRHLACRSFQSFRGLEPAFNQHMLADMLSRLSNTIADKSDDIRGFALEIMVTLNSVTSSFTEPQAEQFPQMFWAAVACMYTPHESEYAQALALLSTYLSKINHGNSELLVTQFPPNWESEFGGLQPLLLKGLKNASCEAQAVDLLKRILQIDNPPLVDPSSGRMLFLLLGALPNLLNELDHPIINMSIGTWASAMAEVFEMHKMDPIARILDSYCRQRFRSQEDFLKQIVNAIRNEYFPQYSSEAIEFLLGLLNNQMGFYRAKSLRILKHIVGHLSQYSREQIHIEVDVLNPLLILLQVGDYAEDALSVLDDATLLSVIPRRESKSNGPVRDCGWHNVHPDIACKTTRTNVQAASYQCSTQMHQPPVDDDFQFSVDDFTMLRHENPDVMGINIASTNDDLVGALQDLDEFFNEAQDTNPNLSPNTRPPFPSPIREIPPSNNTRPSNHLDFTFNVAPPSPLPNLPFNDYPGDSLFAQGLKKNKSSTSLKTSYYIDSLESASLDIYMPVSQR
ncbi:hypothetical protein BZG36_02308 [Bifiguratus adelaidae]|uniref:Cell morphogenesis protein N-terminal domain-containing protein n=1 Tax=Bifiguratus adelaidae TaxID=1938954 RepID=A0A261Y3Q9_9FUNG|nr:hypothetical protein BZG36_02308 [Bifiguratus adelaidae]